MMTSPTFQQFQNPASEVSRPAPGPAHKYKYRWRLYGALILGVAQIALATLMIGVGILKDALWVPTYGMHAYITFGLSIGTGASAIQYSQFGGKCPTITTLVGSILCCLAAGSGLIFNGIFMYDEVLVNDHLQDMVDWGTLNAKDERAMMTAALTVRHTVLYAAEVANGIMIFGCLANGLVNLAQCILACLAVCPCCRSEQEASPNIYMASNPTPEANGAQTHVTAA